MSLKHLFSWRLQTPKYIPFYHFLSFVISPDTSLSFLHNLFPPACLIQTLTFYFTYFHTHFLSTPPPHLCVRSCPCHNALQPDLPIIRCLKTMLLCAAGAHGIILQKISTGIVQPLLSAAWQISERDTQTSWPPTSSPPLFFSSIPWWFSLASHLET